MEEESYPVEIIFDHSVMIIDLAEYRLVMQDLSSHYIDYNV